MGAQGAHPENRLRSHAEFCLPGYSGQQVPACGPPTGEDSGYWRWGRVGRDRRGNQGSQRYVSQSVGQILGLVYYLLPLPAMPI